MSNQSEAEIQRRKTREALTMPLRQLTANLLRIAKGGGKPVELMRQLLGCAAAIQAYIEAHGALPSAGEIQNILDCDAAWREYRPWIEERRKEAGQIFEQGEETEREHAMALIRRGALHAVASMLVNQLPQQNRGEQDITDGIEIWNEARVTRAASYRINKIRAQELVEMLGKGRKRVQKMKAPGK